VIENYYNKNFIAIAAVEEHKPRFRRVHLRSSSHWALKGLYVSPEFGTGKKPRALIDLESHGWRGPIHDILVEGCVLQSAEDTSRWSEAQWNELSCSGIEADGTRMTIRNNRLKNINFGISVSASHSLIEHNTVENFAGDGLRGLGDHCVFQYNLVKNCYDVNANHDDGFQSWTRGPKGVGSGEVAGIVLRGNTIINFEDPQQPHRGTLQGIGCFDGMFVDWIIENNVVIVDHYHGITLGGARNCRIVNNTVIDPNDNRPGPAAIRIGKHKNGTPSSGCTVRNNLTSALHVQSGQVDAGAADLAPKADMAGTSRPEGRGVDIGAYELPAE
jgi:parallel beta-helix repeat protein